MNRSLDPGIFPHLPLRKAMKRLCFVLLLWGMCRVLAFPLLHAQTLEGVVNDAEGGVLPMATFQVQGGRGAVSDVDGRFRYQFPGPGTYKVSIRFMGYQPYDAVLSIQRDTAVGFLMRPEQNLLGEVVVTGTRTPKLLKDIPVVTTVISGREIEKTGSMTIADVLQSEIPGVEFGRQMDGQVVMNMQGMGGTDILFLIDGEKMAGESMNNIDYERLDMDNVERVEIVRGAGSALYGSNAVGGVVNIITKEADEPWSLNVNGRYGSHNEQRYAATLGFDRGKFKSTTNASYKFVDTYYLESTDSAGNVVDRAPIYGGRNINVNQSFRYDFRPGLSLKVRGAFYHRERDYSETRKNRYLDGSAGATLDYQIDEKAHLRFNYAFDLYNKNNFYPVTGITSQEYRNMYNTGNVQFDYSFSETNILSVGAEYFNETLLSNQFDTTENGEWRNYKSHTAVAYAQHDISFKDRYFLVYGLRMDYNSQFRLPHVSPKVSFMYKINPVSIRLSYAGGFRAPSLKERYSNYDMGGQGWFIIYGNPDLRPEKSQNATLSLEYARKSASFTATGYYSYTRDKITTVYNERQDTAFYRNAYSSHTAGFDASLMLKLPYGFGIKLSYSYVYDLQRVDGVNSSYARPHTGVARFDYNYSKGWYRLGVSLSGRVLSALTQNTISGYAEDPETGLEAPVYEQTRYPAYTLWKLNVNQRFMDAFSLNIGIDNLFDYRPRNYDLVSGSLSSGITFFVSLSVDVDDLAGFVKGEKRNKYAR